MTEGAVSLYNCAGRPGAIGHVPSYLAHRFPVAIVRCDAETRSLVRDEAGRCIACAPGETGEALGRLDATSRSAARRFEGYTDPTSSASRLAQDVFYEGDVWYRTGDLMRRDSDGFYYFVDRLGDAFRWKGENISASEVAAALTAFPGVIDAIAFGVVIPGQEGRAGIAGIAAEPSLDLAGLRRHVHTTLPSYARPVFLRLCPSIARTGTFKLSSATLAREGYKNAPLSQLWFDDRETKAYIGCTAALLAEIEQGNMPI